MAQEAREIPADASSWGAFQELRENSRNALHELFEDASKAQRARPEHPSAQGRRSLRELHGQRARRAARHRAARARAEAIATLKIDAQLPADFAHFARLGVSGPIGVFVGADAKHSNDNIVQVTQSGLGMPGSRLLSEAGRRRWRRRAPPTSTTSRSC